MMTWEIRTLAVGQADARLLTTSQNTRVLIDADQDKITNDLDNETIDYLVATHLHDDHVAGLRHLADKGYSIRQAHQPTVARYDVENGDVKPDIQEGYIEHLSALGISPSDIGQLTKDDKILDEEDSSLNVLSPPATGDVLNPNSQETGYQCKFKPEKANPNGAVCKFEGPNDVSGLFMGDVGDEGAHYAESWLLEQHEDPDSEVDVNATVLFIGHHGSKSATGERFLDAVDPDHVVISSSLTNNHTTSENQYDGHPHDETLERLHEKDMEIHWTAVHGTTSTTVEDGTVQIDHTTGIETTAAADLAALKYYGRANDLDQDQLSEIDEIAAADLPDEAPDWIEEAAIVTEPAQTIEKTDEQKAKIDTLHTLEVEHRNLTKRKKRLEREHKQLTVEKDELEQEQKSTSGLWDRFIGALDRSTADTTSDTETVQDNTVTSEMDPDDDQHTTTEKDTKPYQQADNINEAIAILERENTALETAVETHTQTIETVETDIEQIEQQLASSSLIERLNRVVAPFNSTEPESNHTSSDNPDSAGRPPLLQG